MPIAHLHILEGRTDQQKEMLIRKVTAAIVDSLQVSADSVRVLIQEVPKSQWGVGGVPFSQLPANKPVSAEVKRS